MNNFTAYLEIIVSRKIALHPDLEYSNPRVEEGDEWEVFATGVFIPGYSQHHVDLYQEEVPPAIEDLHVELNGVDITDLLTDKDVARLVAQVERDL